MIMTVSKAEEILDMYATRENAVLNDDVESWDAAYQIAFADYKAQCNMHINGQPVA